MVQRLIWIVLIWAVASLVAHALFLFLAFPNAGDGFEFTLVSRSNVGVFTVEAQSAAGIGATAAVLAFATAVVARRLFNSLRKGGETLAGLALLVGAFSVFIVASEILDVVTDQSASGVRSIVPWFLAMAVVGSIVFARVGRKRVRGPAHAR